MKFLHNDSELYMEFGEAINKAVKYVMEKMEKEYKTLIEKIVYRQVGEPEFYDRTGDFENSWVANSYKTANGGVGELYQDDSLLRFNGEKFQHGNNQYGELQAGALTAIIFENLAGDYCNFLDAKAYAYDRDAWTPLINALDKTKMEKWFREGMKLSGITLRRKR